MPIIWLTGQAGAGKTTLALKLVEHLQQFCDEKVFHVDGDRLRGLSFNKDYSRDGRILNVSHAQKIAHYLHSEGHFVVVSLISPYRWQREELKNQVKDKLIEVYVYTDSIRERDDFKVSDYEPPIENFIDLDTTSCTEQESFQELLTKIQDKTRETVFSFYWPMAALA